MGQKIYFGNVEIQNVRTRERLIVKNQLFLEHTNPNDTNFKKRVLRTLKPKQIENYKITRLFFETAKNLGITAEQPKA